MFVQMIELCIPDYCLFCTQAGAVCCSNCKEAILCDTNKKCITEGKLANMPKLNAVHVGVEATTIVRYLMPYSTPAKQLIYAMKFGPSRQVARLLATWMIELCPPEATLITHIPTATQRIRQRGFDHSYVMARQLSRGTNVAYRRLLHRKGVSSRQVGANRSQRKQQARNQYSVLRHKAIKGATIVVVDDVMSTGATIEAVSDSLVQAGAHKVYALVAAVNNRQP